MSTRFLIFYMVALIGVLTLSYFQNLYYPAVPSNLDTAAQTTQSEEPSDSDSQTLQESDKSETGEFETGESDENVETSAAPDPDQSKTQADSATAPEATEDDAETTTEIVSELHCIGSLDPKTNHRFLVTLDSAGGTIRRIELNIRNHRGRYRYRDLEYKGGYLGELDCIDTSDGCKVRIAGPGTPAANAGIKKGDVIQSIDGEPVVTAEDLAAMLAETKPGQSIAVKVARDTSMIDVSIELTDKPIELIRPQPDILDKGWPALPSFRTSLREYSPQKSDWPFLDPAMRDANWNLAEANENQITFEYLIQAKQLVDDSETENGSSAGQFTVRKTFRLPAMQATDATDLARDFHIDFDFEIENKSAQSQKICYQLDGPLGTPSETWWYQNKIHGDNWAFLKTAGARDVIGSTGQEDFTFFGGPAITANMRKTAPEYFWILSPPSESDPAAQAIKFLSVDAQYFNVSLLPKTEQQPFTAYSVVADTTDLSSTGFPKDLKQQKLVDVTFRLFKDLQMEPGAKYKQSFEIFCGPKEGELLEHYGLDAVRSFGWFAMFSKPLCWLLKLFHTLTFKLGYGIPIILLTMVVRSLMIPVSRKAALNAQMMTYLQPQMKEIADKYKDDMEKRGQAQRDLFRKYNYNPFSGCLMMFIQLPIFIGLYRGLSVDIALRDQPLFPGLSWASNLSAPDQFWYWKDLLPISVLTSETGWLGPYLNILPIITCILFVVQQKLFTPPATDENQEMMQKVMKYMMIFMGILFFKVPAGLCVYFITSSIWGIAERKMLPKPELDTTKLDGLVGSTTSSDTKKLEKQREKQEQQDQRRAEEMDEKKRRDKERKKRLKNRGND